MKFADLRTFILPQIGVLEDVRLRTLQGVTCLQALYRGYKVRCQYKKRRKTTIFLQCCELILACSLNTILGPESLLV